MKKITINCATYLVSLFLLAFPVYFAMLLSSTAYAEDTANQAIVAPQQAENTDSIKNAITAITTAANRPQSEIKDLEDIIVPSVLFLMILGIVWATYYFENKNKQAYLETIKHMVDNGKDIPEDFLSGQYGKKKTKTWEHDLRSGLVLSGLGVGLTIFFYTTPGAKGSWGIGMILVGLGLGMLISALIRKKYVNSAK